MVESCGIVTHHEIAYRAFETFDTDAFGGPGYVRGLMEKYKGSEKSVTVVSITLFLQICKSSWAGRSQEVRRQL